MSKKRAIVSLILGSIAAIPSLRAFYILLFTYTNDLSTLGVIYHAFLPIILLFVPIIICGTNGRILAILSKKAGYHGRGNLQKSGLIVSISSLIVPIFVVLLIVWLMIFG